jgi:hypothetical protein
MILVNRWRGLTGERLGLAVKDAVVESDGSLEVGKGGRDEAGAGMGTEEKRTA